MTTLNRRTHRRQYGLGVALAVALLLARPGLAQPAGCTPIGAVVAALTDSDAFEPVRRHIGREAADLLDAYNAIPPATGHVADTILIAPLRGRALERILLFKAGCLILYEDGDRGWADQVLRGGA